MKNNVWSLLLLASIFALGGCGKGGTNSSSSTSSTSEAPSISISGPRNVELGKNATYVADLPSSVSSSPVWSLAPSDMGSITSGGVFTPSKEGTVTIMATAGTISGSLDVTVYSRKATKATLSITGDDLVYNAVTKTHMIPLGKDFYIWATPEESGRAFDSIAFDAVLPSTISSDAVSLDPNGRGGADGYAIQAFSGGALRAKCYYNDALSTPITASISFDVEDRNASNLADLKSFIGSFKEVESASLLSAKIKMDITHNVVADGSTAKSVSSKTDELHSYSDASYTKRVSVSDSVSSQETIYSGVDETSGKYYAMGLDESNAISEVYEKKPADADSVAKTSLFYTRGTQGGHYGISGFLTGTFFETSRAEGDFITFADSRCYAYSSFEVNSEHYKIASSFTDKDSGTAYEVKLDITISGRKISGFTFEETYTGETSSGSLTMSGTDFLFGDKVADSSENPLHIDLSSYYMTSFKMKDIAGTKSDKYDYSDKTKYGANAVGSLADGTVKYITSVNKALVLQVSDLTPSTSSILFDEITTTSSDSATVKAPSSSGGGIFAFSTNKDKEGQPIPGEATITFRSTKGVEVKVGVEFVASALTGIEAADIADDLGHIFPGDKSKYFYLKTVPEGLDYSFALEIVNGPENGISLFDYEDDNKEGVPGFSYAILGVTPGTYSFRFYIVDHEDMVTQKSYSITVDKPYSVAKIKENIIGKSFVRNGDTMTNTLTFESETKLTYSEKLLGADLKSVTLTYRIAEGAIIFDSDQNMLSGMYFLKFLQGNIHYASDFSSLSLKAIVYDSEAEGGGTTISTWTFTKYFSPADVGSYVVGKTYSQELFFTGTFGKGKIDLTFAENTGSILLYSATKDESGNIIGYAPVNTVTFSYVYSSSTYGNYFSLSNIAGYADDGLTSIKGSDNQMEYTSSDNTIRFKIAVNGGTLYSTAAIKLF